MFMPSIMMGVWKLNRYKTLIIRYLLLEKGWTISFIERLTEIVPMKDCC